MMHRSTLSTLLVGAAFFTMAGCKISPPAPPTTPMTEEQVEAVADCQTAIKKEGAKFINYKLKKLEQCVDEVLELQLYLENGLITQAQFDAKLDQLRAKCTRNYNLISKASTKLVDGIIKKCEPVEDLVFGADDPLQFQTLSSEGGPSLGSLESMVGTICGVKELLVDAAVGIEVPRMCHVLETLGPEFVIVNEDPDFCLPNIPLDPRCPPFFAPAP